MADDDLESRLRAGIQFARYQEDRAKADADEHTDAATPARESTASTYGAIRTTLEEILEPGKHSSGLSGLTPLERGDDPE